MLYTVTLIPIGLLRATAPSLHAYYLYSPPLKNEAEGVTSQKTTRNMSESAHGVLVCEVCVWTTHRSEGARP